MYRQKKQSSGLLISGSMVSKKYTADDAIATLTRSKKKHYWYIIIGIVLLLPVGWYWLRSSPAVYFSYPLGISPELAASFGEVRKDHFHMGLDLRTKGRENFPVYAIADGFISRIQISEKGFGKAVFVTHPNGITSVYAHLNRFSNDLEKHIHQQQYQQQQWEQDISFPKDRFPVQKGDLIARSGNTGTSEGPHLHLELRNTLTGKSINPQTAGFAVPDNVHPVIKNIYWYNKQGSIYETNATRLTFTTASDQTVEVSSPYIVLGIETFDKSAETRFQLGIYKATLYMDDLLMHHLSMDELADNDTRYVNAGIDYKEYVASRKTIQLLTTLPGNKLALFSRSPANGVLDIHDQKAHYIRIEIQDAAGNISSIAFYIRFNGIKQASMSYPHNVVFIPAGKDTILQQGQTMLHISKNTLFDRVPVFITTTNTSRKNTASPCIDIYPFTTPVYDSLEITIPTTLSKEDTLRKHVVMLAQTSTGRSVVKGTWNNNTMTGRLPGFGTVQMVIDTIPPSIALMNPRNARFPSDDGVVRVVCKDNLGNIAAFRATIDGNWAAFERKGNVFTYQPDEYCRAGVHDLTITASDIAGNITSQTFTIIR